MPTEKLGNQTSQLYAKICSYCSALQGNPSAPKLSACSRCGLVVYCSKDCQRAHWKADHKQHCIAKAERATAPLKPIAMNMISLQEAAEQTKCVICQDMVSGESTRCTLPCTHIFHGACVAELRKFGVEQACPLCRTLLPPGPEQRNEEASRRYMVVFQMVERGDASWSTLPVWARQEVDAAIVEWQAAADEGNACAQFNIGFQHETGYSVVQSDVEAAHWFKRAAEQGYVIAQHKLGDSFENVHGVAQSDVESARWFKKAAERGHANSQNNLGVCFLNGCGVDQCYLEAARWFKNAAEQGHAQAQYNLGKVYREGYGVAQSFKEAARWWRKAADQEHAEAQYTLGVLYESGRGVGQSYKEAAKWYRKAADQGHANAQDNLGGAYELGDGVAQSYSEARHWFQKAASQGHSGAQYNLGSLFERGCGVEHNDEVALLWFRKAADQGHTKAQYNMGLFSLSGRGIGQSDVEAARWFQMAAELGSVEAQFVLGSFNGHRCDTEQRRGCSMVQDGGRPRARTGAERLERDIWEKQQQQPRYVRGIGR